jgi:hypothetical protein
MIEAPKHPELLEIWPPKKYGDWTHDLVEFGKKPMLVIQKQGAKQGFTTVI